MEIKAFVTKEETDKILNDPNTHFDTVSEGVLTVTSYVNARIEEINAGRKGNARMRVYDEVPPYIAAAVCHKLFVICEIVPSGVENESEIGVLALYHENGPHAGTYRSMDFTGPFSLNSLADACNPTCDERWFKDFSRKVRNMAERVTEEENRDLIPMQNCIFDYRKRTTVPFDSKYVFLNKNATNMPASKPALPVIDTGNGMWDPESWLGSLVEGETETLLLKVICASLRPFVDWQKMFILYNERGSNGKGTVLETVRGLVGSRNVASIPLRDFSKEFGMAEAIGRRVNLVDENDVGGYIDNAANLKAAVTNDVVKINRKHKDAISYRMHMVMIQCMNELPRVRDKSDSMLRRFTFIGFTGHFDENEKNRAIKTDYVVREDVREWLVWKLFMEMDQFWEIDETGLSNELKTEYRLESDSVAMFWDEFKNSFVNDFVPFGLSHQLYCRWLKVVDPNGKALGQTAFSRRLKAEIARDGDWEVIDGRSQKLGVPGWVLLCEPSVLEYAKHRHDNVVGRDVVDKDDALGKWYYPNKLTMKQTGGVVRKETLEFCARHNTNPGEFISAHCKIVQGAVSYVDADLYSQFKEVVASGREDFDDVEFVPKLRVVKGGEAVKAVV